MPYSAAIENLLPNIVLHSPFVFKMILHCLLIYYDQREEGDIQTHGMLTSGDQIIIAEGNNSNRCDGSEVSCITYFSIAYTGTGAFLKSWQGNRY